MTRFDRYVGPVEIADRVAGGCGGIVVDSVETLDDWLRSMDDFQRGGSHTVTFVIALDGDPMRDRKHQGARWFAEFSRHR